MLGSNLGPHSCPVRMAQKLSPPPTSLKGRDENLNRQKATRCSPESPGAPHVSPHAQSLPLTPFAGLECQSNPLPPSGELGTTLPRLLTEGQQYTWTLGTNFKDRGKDDSYNKPGKGCCLFLFYTEGIGSKLRGKCWTSIHV